MASYSQFLGRTVTVQYRAGDIFLPASGTLVGDSGRSIFLEQHLQQRGKLNYFRWEIPYQCIHRIEEAHLPQSEPLAESSGASRSAEKTAEARAAAAASDASSCSGSSSLLPLPQRPKTA